MPGSLRNLIGWLRTTPTSSTLMRRLALAAIVTNAGIVVTGGAVRLSGSGLGCPTWPDCTDGRLLPGGTNTHGAINQAIEFSNRMLTFLVFVIAAACVIAAWRLRPKRTGVLKIAWLLPAGVAAQAVIGGITVRAKLNPLAVAPHFLASMVLVYVAVWLYVRTGEGDAPVRRIVRRELQWGVVLLIGILAAVEIVGTLVTATGPHAGDPGTRRLSWDPHVVTQFHADLVFLYVGAVTVLALGLRATGAPRPAVRRAYEVFVVMILQAVVGFVQYFTHVPEVLVGIHMFGATLATIATARLFFATRVRDHDLADELPIATQADFSGIAQRGAAH
ncbi:MAG TPA: COX15/CtaA family protein [Mycobacteriales bacterium]|nr:COX15/CtaA family protein [Mycobacteriales bacterium]